MLFFVSLISMCLGVFFSILYGLFWRHQWDPSHVMYHLRLVSFLIFSLDDLSIGVSGVVKPPPIFVLLSVLFFCLLVFGLTYMFLLPFYNCLGLILWIFFLLLYFLTIEVHLTFVVKLVWWYWILLTFACLKSFWFFHQFWLGSLPGTVILVVDFSLSVL